MLLEAARRSATVLDPHLLRVLDADDVEGHRATWSTSGAGHLPRHRMLADGPLVAAPRRLVWPEVADRSRPRTRRASPTAGWSRRTCWSTDGRCGQGDRLRRRRRAQRHAAGDGPPPTSSTSPACCTPPSPAGGPASPAPPYRRLRRSTASRCAPARCAPASRGRWTRSATRCSHRPGRPARRASTRDGLRSWPRSSEYVGDPRRGDRPTPRHATREPPTRGGPPRAGAEHRRPATPRSAAEPAAEPAPPAPTTAPTPAPPRPREPEPARSTRDPTSRERADRPPARRAAPRAADPGGRARPRATT